MERIETPTGTITISDFGSWYELAHQPRERNIDTLRAPVNDPSVDYIPFTGVAVTGYDHQERRAFRALVPAREEYRAATGGMTRADRAGLHTVAPTDAAIAAAVTRARQTLAQRTTEDATHAR